MVLDVQDERLRLRLTLPSENTARLTLDYPREETYRHRVMSALSDLLRPAVSASTEQQIVGKPDAQSAQGSAQ